MINKVFCFTGEENDIKYLNIDKGTKSLEVSVFSLWNKVFSGIKYYIKRINHECKTFSKCKGLPECEEFGKMVTTLIKLNLLVMILYHWVN